MLAFARGVGEFGATIIFAGNVRGETQTLTLAVYEQLEADFDVALSIGILLVVLSAGRAALLQAALALAQLELDITVPLRAFDVAVALSVGARDGRAASGPSGAGKTTVLRAVAGLQRPDSRPHRARRGDLVRHAPARSTSPPERRSVGLVFQDYALFPHLSVARQRRASAARERVDELLERLGIAQLAAREARAGCRAASASASRSPARWRATRAVLLLDEPLAALDAHTRAEVREQLADVLAELALPALIVTHDFRDAAALADRVGVLLEGRLHQLGTPAELLARPADAFVASLTGGNVLLGHATAAADGGSSVRLDSGATIRSRERAAGRVGVAIHPWHVGVEHEPRSDAANAIAGMVGATTLHGGRHRVRIGELLAERAVDGGVTLERGATAYAVFAPEDVRLVPPARKQEDST